MVGVSSLTIPLEEKQWILMTGAAGLLGRYIRYALNDHYRFWCIDKSEIKDMYVGDIADQIDIGSLSGLTEIWDRRPDITAKLHGVIHFAAYYDYRNSGSPENLRVNQGLERLLMLVSKDAPGDCVFVSAGSLVSLAPVRPGQRLTENSPRSGLWDYPRSKLQAERLLDQSIIRQPIVQLILAPVYTDWCEFYPLFQWIELCNAAGPEKHFFPGPPTRGLTYCHIDDVVAAFEIVLKRYGAGGDLITEATALLNDKRARNSVEVAMEGGVREKFLIGQPQPLTYREIHARASTAFRGKPVPLIQLPLEIVYYGAQVLEWFAKLRRIDRFVKPWMISFSGYHYAIDSTLARVRLGWLPKKSIQQDLDGLLVKAVRDRANWLKTNFLRAR